MRRFSARASARASCAAFIFSSADMPAVSPAGDGAAFGWGGVGALAGGAGAPPPKPKRPPEEPCLPAALAAGGGG
eukprot:3254212-Rhodomonas_salina.1